VAAAARLERGSWRGHDAGLRHKPKLTARRAGGRCSTSTAAIVSPQIKLSNFGGREGNARATSLRVMPLSQRSSAHVVTEKFCDGMLWGSSRLH
jgi:hypothetical protein